MLVSLGACDEACSARVQELSAELSCCPSKDVAASLIFPFAAEHLPGRCDLLEHAKATGGAAVAALLPWFLRLSGALAWYFIK